ncbi:MAG: endonuclease [Candidatus Omnitrophica bacterium CG07_land_8_20_14_0_80_42_15]|uniref:Endonuclease n=1 Tax=Candidatus Aquitaenariimonas noxiae TaxID=1974741 RepID=A0A2J0KSC9_9BACT|nr:MAG: endonuclease [Candidatus Omnitrophica bacterium CG07_land_8_20_14_0_80_42_15]
MNKKVKLLEMYDKMYKHFGPRHWWPADTPFEVMVGAILTQNTSWKNVEKAIRNLKGKKVLNLKSLYKLNINRLALLIRPAGFYNLKAKRLKNFVNFLFLRYNNTKSIARRPLALLRNELLEVKGVGPETADSILLYALGKPVFVVDAYTKRILTNHGFIKKDAGYDEIQKLFMDNLPRKRQLFNEYHALIVETGKNFCRKKPLCGICPLKGLRPWEKYIL